MAAKAEDYAGEAAEGEGEGGDVRDAEMACAALIRREQESGEALQRMCDQAKEFKEVRALRLVRHALTRLYQMPSYYEAWLSVIFLLTLQKLT